MQKNAINYKSMRLVYIEWEDAVHNAEWFTPEQAKHWHESTNYTVRECGWLVKEDKKGITIAGRFKPKDNDIESQIGGLQYIPRPWIKKRKNIII